MKIEHPSAQTAAREIGGRGGCPREVHDALQPDLFQSFAERQRIWSAYGLGYAAHARAIATPYRPPTGIDIDALIAKRALHRERREWALADAVRAELVAVGVVLEDAKGGTGWRVAV